MIARRMEVSLWQGKLRMQLCFPVIVLTHTYNPLKRFFIVLTEDADTNNDDPKVYNNNDPRVCVSTILIN